jgi:hypothetical protein
VYGGSYYVVTAFVSANMGGTVVFSSGWCGSDVTKYLNSLTAQKPLTKDILVSYWVGPVR